MYLADCIQCDYHNCKSTTPKIDVIHALKASGMTGDDLRFNAGAIIATRNDESAEDAGWAFQKYGGDRHFCPKHACTPVARKASAEPRDHSRSRPIALHHPCIELTPSERLMQRLHKRTALTAARKGRNW